MFGVGKAGDVVAVSDGGGVAATDDLRAEGEMDFVHEIGAEEGAVQFATAFAEEAFDFPFFAKPMESSDKIELLLSEGFYFVSDLFEAFEAALGNGASGQDDDWGEAVAENVRRWIDGAGTADDHAKVVFGETAAKTHFAILF